MAIGRRAARTAEACSTHDGLVPDMDLGSGLRHGEADGPGKTRLSTLAFTLLLGLSLRRWPWPLALAEGTLRPGSWRVGCSL
jgi:hypothetical protein